MRYKLALVACALSSPPSFAQTQTHYGTVPPATAPVGWTSKFFDNFQDFTPAPFAPFAQTSATRAFGAAPGYALGINPSTFHLNGKAEQQYYSSPGRNGINPFSYSNGILSITASTPLPSEKAKLGGYQFISGALSTSPFLRVTTGYFELKAQLPAGAGMWSAFWVTGINNWPPEFDIMEQFGSHPNELWATLHYGRKAAWRDGIDPAKLETDITTGFHVYGGLLTPTYAAWYFDGNLIGYTKKGFGAGRYNFNSTNPMQVVVNLAIGTGMGDKAARPSQLPAALKIEWLRYSELGPQ